jgi:hypothetical protein
LLNELLFEGVAHKLRGASEMQLFEYAVLCVLTVFTERCSRSAMSVGPTPSFDQPLEMLLTCHQRIEEQRRRT